MLADERWLRAFQAAACFGVLQVRCSAPATIPEIARSLGQEVCELLVIEFEPTRSPNARRNAAEELLYQRAQVRLHIAIEEIGADEAHATVDVVADAAGR